MKLNSLIIYLLPSKLFRDAWENPCLFSKHRCCGTTELSDSSGRTPCAVRPGHCLTQSPSAEPVSLRLAYHPYHVLRKTEMNTVQESLKSIKNMIFPWLSKLKDSLSFSYYILGSHFISSSQFSRQFRQVLNFNQDFRLQQYSGVLKYCWKWDVYAEMAFLWFTCTCCLCSFIYTCP